MLFNSYTFLFAFLPVTVLVHQLLVGRAGGRVAMAWLAAMSLLFYAWWYPPYLLLLLGSMTANFAFGRVVSDQSRTADARANLLRLAVFANLFFLGFYKYAGFLDANLEALTGAQLPIPVYALPIGISFFTFQQIAYVVDAYRGVRPTESALDYVMFVSFFPHLIAGPITHHGEMLPQFRAARTPTWEDRAIGLSMFILGLAKKLLVADWCARLADPVWAQVHGGMTPTVTLAWAAVFAYHFQIYFDFSGYSDMAIGLARMFGIVFPQNFDAPYRANSMIDFWRRWHVSLGRFLRDYLYIALGGSRHGTFRRYFNLFATMVLGGLWHGAGWGFIVWGAANGLFLLINHGWRKLIGGEWTGRGSVVVGRTLTLLGWMIGFVFFRSQTLGDAFTIFGALTGIEHAGIGKLGREVVLPFAALFAFTQIVPTSQRWMERFGVVLKQGEDTLRWRSSWMWAPTPFWAIVIGVLFFLCVPMVERASPFIYWAF